jgi:uncharacterized SAM-binding protein YcdF (DUF218 family)
MAEAIRMRFLIRARWTGAFFALLVTGSTLCIIWVAHAPLFRAAAHAWVVSDPLEPADAIVVLGGGLDVRPFAAADLYKKGLARQILIANVGVSQVERLGLLPRHSDLIREALLKLGVPPEAIGTFGDGVRNTYEEACALREWAKATAATRIILPTEHFSSRRVRWIFGRELGRIGVLASVQALSQREYSVNDWWRHEEGVIAFQNEVIKYIYYRVKY